MSLLAKKRVNRFDEVVERLPEAKLGIYNFKLGESKFYYKGEFSAVNLNKKFPSSTDEKPVAVVESHHNNRYDAYNQLSYPARADWISITPYAGTRQTYFERGRNNPDFEDSSHIRGLFYTGVDLSTKIHKVYDITGSPMGIEINNLRHIITPTFGYNYIHPAPLERNKVFEFDEIDYIDRESVISLGIVNALQTKRDNGNVTHELLRFSAETGYDFRHTPGTQLLDYETKLEFTPYDWLSFVSDAVFDPHKRSNHEWLKELNNDISIQQKNWSLGLGHRYVEDNHGIIGQLDWQITPKWKIGIYEDFDFKRITADQQKKIWNLREQEYVITRDLHCWEMDVRFNIKDEGEEMVMIVFRLKAFPDVPFEFGKTYRKPKTNTQTYSFTQFKIVYAKFQTQAKIII